ncbi:hypothetical protein QJS10_CPA02g00081 [Acorus calamus]|uniref:Uncharacterized protein n=1 Tax=Acorus calamus TaxID=4465 RepID=A0AAV9FD72_ACOCL|nr:hypothetical protein QJS10_CPA02g00081 [Acorus calamus]
MASFTTIRGGAGGGGGEPRVRRGQPGCGGGGGLDKVAMWIGNGVAAAFFASLERCSCINVTTAEEAEEEGEESKSTPLIRGGGGGQRRRRTWKGKKRSGTY